MIDQRIYTFLELCNVMNYHKTAENLNMTQPAVTQHIKHLEQLYRCPLFRYEKKTLYKTEQCLSLEKYARTIIALNQSAVQSLSQQEKVSFNIGATKTIGEYMLHEVVYALFNDDRYEINIHIDNTERLLDQLHHFKLDVLMLEGYVDKEQYHHQKISDEEMVGICAMEHPFAGQTVSLQEVLQQNIILREDGSGTRAVFERFLNDHGYHVDSFQKKSILSSNKLIELAVQHGHGISFVYHILPKQNHNLATFRIKESNISHEFNYIFLNEEKAQKAMALLRDKML